MPQRSTASRAPRTTSSPTCITLRESHTSRRYPDATAPVRPLLRGWVSTFAYSERTCELTTRRLGPSRQRTSLATSCLRPWLESAAYTSTLVSAKTVFIQALSRPCPIAVLIRQPEIRRVAEPLHEPLKRLIALGLCAGPFGERVNGH